MIEDEYQADVMICVCDTFSQSISRNYSMLGYIVKCNDLVSVYSPRVYQTKPESSHVTYFVQSYSNIVSEDEARERLTISGLKGLIG